MARRALTGLGPHRACHVADKQPKNNRRNPADHLKAYRFPPGQSGNPNGRPKVRTLTERLRDLLEKYEFDGKPIEDGKQVADQVVESLARGAIDGDSRHQQELWNRVEGKVPDRIIADVTSRDADRDRSECDAIIAALRHRGGIAAAEGHHGSVEPGGPGGDGIAGPLGHGPAPGDAEP
jgi:hypothetical protein